MTHGNIVEVHVVSFAGGGILNMLCECGSEFKWSSRPDHVELPADGLTFCPTCGNRAHTSPTPQMLDAVGIHTREARKKDPNYHDPMGSVRSMAKTIEEVGGLGILVDVDHAAWDASHPIGTVGSPPVNDELIEGMRRRTAERIEDHRQHHSGRLP